MKKIYLSTILVCSCFFGFTQVETELIGDWYLHYRTDNGVTIEPPLTVEENYNVILNFGLLPPNAGNPFTFESHGPTTTTFEGRYEVDNGLIMLFNLDVNMANCEHPTQVCDYFEAYNNEILFDSNTISNGEYVASYTITGPEGNETLTLTNNVTGDFAVYGELALSNLEFTKQPITVYPNPVKDVLNVFISDLNTMYSIYSIDGKTIINNTSLKESIDVSALQTGLYFLKIDNKRPIRFIKK